MYALEKVAAAGLAVAMASCAAGMKNAAAEYGPMTAPNRSDRIMVGGGGSYAGTSNSLKVPTPFVPKTKMGLFLLEASQEVIDAGEAFDDPAAELAALWGARSG